MNDLSTTQLIGLAVGAFTVYLGRDYLAPLLAKLKGLLAMKPQPGGEVIEPPTVKTTLSRVQLWEELYQACAPELCCTEARVLLDKLWPHIAPNHKDTAHEVPK